MKTKELKKKVHFGLIGLNPGDVKKPINQIVVAFSQSFTPRWSVLPAQGGLAAVDEVYRKFPGCSISYSGQRIWITKVSTLRPDTLFEFMKSIWLKASRNIRGPEPTKEELFNLYAALTSAEGELFRQEINFVLTAAGEKI